MLSNVPPKSTLSSDVEGGEAPDSRDASCKRHTWRTSCTFRMMNNDSVYTAWLPNGDKDRPISQMQLCGISLSLTKTGIPPETMLRSRYTCRGRKQWVRLTKMRKGAYTPRPGVIQQEKKKYSTNNTRGCRTAGTACYNHETVALIEGLEL